MSVFALADLHLSFTGEKPMDVFGPRWENHTSRIYENWQKTVAPEDTVVIPGDISWGMNFGTTADDLRFIDSLNGKKLIGKGNHDYWWQTMRKMRAFTAENGFESIDFLFNNAFAADGVIICGTRGWILGDDLTAEDDKIIAREVGRLRASLEAGRALLADNPDFELTVFMHYPPAYNGAICRPITDVLTEYGIKRCYYGHIHGAPASNHEAYADGTRLTCVAADYVGFMPTLVNKP